MASQNDGKVQGYKRINFFRGFLTTEHDWNEAEAMAERRRRTDSLDTFGRCVVPDTTPDAFLVTPTGIGDLSIGIVAPMSTATRPSAAALTRWPSTRHWRNWSAPRRSTTRHSSRSCRRRCRRHSPARPVPAISSTSMSGNAR